MRIVEPHYQTKKEADTTMSLDNESSNTGFVNVDTDEVMVVPTTDK
jgi:hypothetical protein